MGGPLKGIKVLDLTRLLPGPLCTHLLTRLGAEVVKVEQPGGNGDYVRYMPPMINFKDGATHGALFESLNGQKKNIVLDLKSPAGVSVLKRLASQHDVIVEGNRPGVMDRLGVGFNDIKLVNDQIVYCSISGYGATGPMARRAGHDINYMAISGLLGLSGSDGTSPPLPGFQAADAAGALQAVIGIQAAIIEKLMHSNKSNRSHSKRPEAQHIDISLCESSMALAVPALVNGLAGGDTTRGVGYLDGGLPNYQVYETSDGWYISVGALEPHFWAKLIDHLHITRMTSTGADDIVDAGVGGNSPNFLSKDETVELFRSKSLAEWMSISEQCDVCLEPIIDVKSLPTHPQHAHRDVFIPSLDGGKRKDGHQQEDDSTAQQAGTDASCASCASWTSMSVPHQLVLGPRMSNHPVSALRRAAGFGENTVDVLTEAGFSEQEIDLLVESKTVVVQRG